MLNSSCMIQIYEPHFFQFLNFILKDDFSCQIFKKDNIKFAYNTSTNKIHLISQPDKLSKFHLHACIRTIYICIIYQQLVIYEDIFYILTAVNKNNYINRSPLQDLYNAAE